MRRAKKGRKVEKLGDSINVIELHAENRGRILRGEPCVSSMLHFYVDMLIC